MPTPSEPVAVEATAAGNAAAIPLEPWNGSPELSQVPALQLGLQNAQAGSAQELALLLRLACALRFTPGWDALAYAMRAHRLARRRGDHSAQAMATAFRCVCYLNKGRDRLACVVAKTALGRSRAGASSPARLYLHSMLGYALNYRGQLSDAVDVQVSLLNRTYFAGFAGLRAQILNSLGLVAMNANLLRQAARLFLAAQRLEAVVHVEHRKMRWHHNNMAMVLVNEAKQARRLGHHEQARRLAERAVQLARDAFEYSLANTQTHNERHVLDIADTLAKALYLSGRSDEAMTTVESIREQMMRTAIKPGAHVGGQDVRAQVLLDRGDATAAIAAALPIFTHLRDQGAAEGAVDLAVVLSQAHEQLGQWHEAYQYAQWLRQTAERRGNERIALNLSELAAKLDLGRGDLMPYLAHELRSPLTSVLTLLDAHEADQPLTAAQRADVRARAAAALDTTERVLDYARLQSLRQIEQHSFDLFALLDDACDEVGTRARARGVRITLDHSASLFTTGDRTLLLRAVVGLFDNALRHSPPGGTVHVQLEDLGYCVRLCIEDEGEGFNLDDVAHLFERKASADSEQRINLGLPLAARVIALHDGALLLDNRPEGGAKVLIALPPASA
jgi:signal transduction histidine kinase